MYEIRDVNSRWKDYFVFDGAYDSDGYEIFTQTKSTMIDWYVGFLMTVSRVDFHERGLMAAFGR